MYIDCISDSLVNAFSRTWRAACVRTELPVCFAVLVSFHLLFGHCPQMSGIKNITVSSIPPSRWLSVKIILEQRHRDPVPVGSYLKYPPVWQRISTNYYVGYCFSTTWSHIFSWNHPDHISLACFWEQNAEQCWKPYWSQDLSNLLPSAMLLSSHSVKKRN